MMAGAIQRWADKAVGAILARAHAYSAWSALINAQTDARTKRFLPDGDFSIIDVGCGPGSNAHLFQDRDYLGIDISTDYIAAARTAFPDMKFEVADATALESERTYDVALIHGVLHHLPDTDAVRLLEGVKRFLTPGGRAIIQESLVPPRASITARFFTRLDRGKHVRPHDAYVALIEEAGLAVADEEVYSVRLLGVATTHTLAAKLVVA